MGDLSPHFSRSEFRDKRTGALPRGLPSAELVQVLEHLRAIDGRSLPVLSGYRSPATNRLAGGKRRSQHLVGRAADIPGGRFTVDQARRAGARGIGVRRGWVVHVDVRPGAVVVFEDPVNEKSAGLSARRSLRLLRGTSVNHS
jgi:uncharacterized protein YcbK (DUF882 family)